MASAARKILSPLGARGATSASVAEREGDVGRHGNRPPSRLHAAAVRQEIDRRGDHHAADRAGDRQRCLAQGRQFAGQHLALDLQPDQQKEDRHQPVVDPLMKR